MTVPRQVSVLTHIPVLITAGSKEGLRLAVRALKERGQLDYTTSDPDENPGSFKIISKGVKLKDVRAQWNKVVSGLQSSEGDEDIFLHRRASPKKLAKNKRKR